MIMREPYTHDITAGSWTCDPVPAWGQADRRMRRHRAHDPDALREALNDQNDIFALESEPPSLSEKFLSLRPNDAAFGFARNSDTAASAKLEHAFSSEGAKCPQHG